MKEVAITFAILIFAAGITHFVHNTILHWKATQAVNLFDILFLLGILTVGTGTFIAIFKYLT